METVHGPKLGSLIGELLQPLDPGSEVQKFTVQNSKGLTHWPYAPSWRQGTGEGEPIDSWE